MAIIIKINGAGIPNPSAVSMVKSTTVDASRNADGVTVGQIVGRTLNKLDGLTWNVLSAAQWASLLTIFDQFSFNVTFVDPQTNDWVTRPCYVGDRSATPFAYDSNGKPTFYRDCKANLIDTGA